MPKEKLLFNTRIHWIVFTSTVIWLIISLLIFTLCRSWSFFNTILFDHAVYIWLGWLALFITLMHGITAYMRYFTSEYAITDKRILMKTGLMQHKVLEIFLTKIESVHASQNVIGRLLDFGVITISGAGGEKEPLLYVPRPLEFRKIIHAEINK
jgi:uncharacterized membrane protein YdbT with pleckstrin-like domain